MKSENTFLENKGDIDIFTVYICNYILVLLLNLFYHVFTFRIYIHLQIQCFRKMYLQFNSSILTKMFCDKNLFDGEKINFKQHSSITLE